MVFCFTKMQDTQKEFTYGWKKRAEKVGVFIQLTRYAHHLFKGFVTFIDLNPPGDSSHSCCLDSFSMLFSFSLSSNLMFVM